MCLVGMIEAQAGIKVESAGSGSYILTFTNTTDGTVDWNSLPSYVRSATSLKIVTEGDYKLTTNDMQYIMGNDEAVGGSAVSSVFGSTLKNLDMIDAELSNYNDLKFMRTASNNGSHGLNKLETFDFPKKTTVIPEGMFHNNHSIKEVNMWENDETDNPLSLFETIPNNCFQCCSKLTNVRIPEGVKHIGKNAFGGTESEPAPPIEAIHFPNTLVTIGENAFAYNSKLTSITIPANVTAIGKSAFQKNNNLEDVYVLGNHVITCDGAFNEEFTYDGFTYDNKNDGDDSVVSIKDWKSNKNYVKHPLRLHIPKDSEAYRYCVNPFLRALNELTEKELKNINSAATKEKLHTYGIKTDNLYMFASDQWVEMDGHRYFKQAGDLFNQWCGSLDGSLANGHQNYTAFNGWHNFMFAAGDVDEKIWHDGRMVESRWYSAVFPFDMSYNQLMTAYGAKTDIREFSFVNRHIVDTQEQRTVTFSKKPAIPDNNKNKAGYVKKGTPYMIHPGVRSVPVEVTRSATVTIHRTIAGVDVNTANDVIEKEEPSIVLGDLVDGDKPLRGNSGFETITKDAYIFKGTYKKSDIPANSFYLGYEPPRWPLAYYVARVKQTGKWTAFTSIVQKVQVEATQAKTMDLGFSELFSEDFGIATEIEQIPVVENRCESNAVYNLNGQVVRENNAFVQGLSKGIYVVNGKKIVVK